MKYRKNIIALILLSILLLNCEKLVEIDSPIDQINSADVFEDTYTADAALANLFIEIRDNSLLSGGSRGMSALLSSYTDDTDAYFINNTNAALDIYNNQQLATNTSIESLWRNSYKEIYLANSIIEGIDNSNSIPVADKQRIKGQALFIRSFLYFELQRLFGDIPYVTTTDYQINKTIPKTSAQNMLKNIEQDLLQSINYLPENYTYSERLIPNRKVAQLVLAELYLEAKNWQKAEQLAKEILSSSLYSYETDVSKVFLKAGKHILWQVKPQNTNDRTLEAQLYYFTNSVPPSYALSNSLLTAFESNDLRKQMWITPVTFNQQTWYRPNKYKSLAPNTTEYSIICRLEQAYFILAESLAEQDRVSEAIPYVNASRQRAGLAALPSTLSKAVFLNEMLQEKRREFFTEFGQRFFDLKRLGKLQELSVVKPNWKSYHQLWPIPQSEILLNTNLSPQNEGY